MKTYPPSGGTFEQTGIASWYGEEFHGKPMACGEPYDMYSLSAAHNTIPLGATVRVTNVSNGRQVTLPIKDRGPFVGNRIIDLSYGAAKQLDMIKVGLAKVRVEVVQTPRAFTERYTVQFGAFTEKGNAVALADSLRKTGHVPAIEEATAHGRHFYRVRIGAFSSIGPAQELASAFGSRGIACIVIGL